MDATFTCANCGGVFTKTDPTGARADMEAEALWGVKDLRSRPEAVTICDDCFQTMNPTQHVDVWEAVAALLHGGRVPRRVTKRMAKFRRS